MRRLQTLPLQAFQPRNPLFPGFLPEARTALPFRRKSHPPFRLRPKCSLPGRIFRSPQSGTAGGTLRAKHKAPLQRHRRPMSRSATGSTGSGRRIRQRKKFISPWIAGMITMETRRKYWISQRRKDSRSLFSSPERCGWMCP